MDRFTLNMPFRPYPGNEADLLYGKSVKKSLVTQFTLDSKYRKSLHSKTIFSFSE